MDRNTSNPLKEMLFKLMNKKGIVNIPFDQIVNSFSDMNETHEMGNGKTIKTIFFDEKQILLECFMPKKTIYRANVHEDANEIVTVITGKLRNTNFRLTKESMGQFSWKAGTPHSLEAIEDCVFYALITKV